MSDKPKEKNRKARVAWVLRTRLANGGTLTDNERQWLTEYERAHRPGRPSKSPPPLVQSSASPSPEPIGIASPEPSPSESTGGVSPPPLHVAPPVAESVTSPPSFDSDGPAFQKPQVTEDEDARRQGRGYADLYCKWLKGILHDSREMGGMVPSDDMVDQVLRPMAEGSFTRLAKSMGGAISEGAQDTIVIAAPIAAHVQRHFLKKRLPNETVKRSPAKVITMVRPEENVPPKQETQEQPSAPPARSGPIAPGTLEG